MSFSLALEPRQRLFWPALTMLSLISVAAFAPIATLSAVLAIVLLIFGVRYPTATAAAVLAIIPVVDQAVSETEFSEFFGAFRLTPAVALKAMMSFVALSYLWRNRINPFKHPLLQPLVIWLGYTGFTCLLFHDRALSFSMWMRLAYWVLHFVFFFIVASRESVRDEHHLVRIRQLWQAGLAALALFAGSVLLAKAMGKGGDYYGVGESYGFYADPWNMAMTLPGLLALSLLHPWVFGNSGWRKTVCIVLGGVAVLASFMTFTRTSLIACFVAAIVFSFVLKIVIVSRETRLIFAIALTIVSTVALLVIVNVNSTSSGNQVAARWSEVDKGDIGSGRLQVFYAAWTKFMNASPTRKLFGHGIGAGPEAAEEFMGVYVYLHDDILEMLVSAGLIGLVLYCWFFVRSYRAILAGIRAKNVWAVAALVAFIVYNVTSISYMRIYAVTPNTYFALVAGTSMGVLQRKSLAP